MAERLETREQFPGVGTMEVSRTQRVPTGLAHLSVGEAVTLTISEEQQDQLDGCLGKFFPAETSRQLGFRRPIEITRADHTAKVVRLHVSAFKPLPGEEEGGFDYSLGVARVDHAGRVAHVIEERVPFKKDRRFYYILADPPKIKIYTEIPPIQKGQLTLVENESATGMAESDFLVLMRSLGPATWRTRASRHTPKMRGGIFALKHPLFTD